MRGVKLVEVMALLIFIYVEVTLQSDGAIDFRIRRSNIASESGSL